MKDVKTLCFKSGISNFCLFFFELRPLSPYLLIKKLQKLYIFPNTPEENNLSVS